MSAISVAGDSSGSITIAAPAVAGSGTLTLPVATDTLIGKATTDTLTNKTLTSPTITGATITVAATAAPAFSAYRSTNQAITANTNTKIVCDIEEFDTNNNFASGTFTPTVAGYYQVSAAIAASAVTNIEVTIRKNGSGYKILSSSFTSNIASGGGSCLVYCNGTTDYIDFYVSFSASLNAFPGSAYTWFQASMIRSA
jgi:hypothetical protein